jgi:hypothetical protein
MTEDLDQDFNDVGVRSFVPTGAPDFNGLELSPRRGSPVCA